MDMNNNLLNKIAFDKFTYLEKNKDKLEQSKINFLIDYFADGKEIPYPLFKDRREVMNPK